MKNTAMTPAAPWARSPGTRVTVSPKKVTDDTMNAAENVVDDASQRRQDAAHGVGNAVKDMVSCVTGRSRTSPDNFWG